jgi:hypothetical protein
MKMKIRFFSFLCLFTVLVSCADDTKERQAEIARDVKKKALVFDAINKSWNFNTQPLNATSQSLLSNWTAWRELLGELSQKPQSSIGAFQKKAKTLSKKAAQLPKAIPMQYDKPEIRSRISVLVTKINSLNLFINLDEIPDKKVTSIIGDINTELASLQAQLDEIVRKSKIPKEEGESDMLRMLDTSRAIPTTPVKPIPVKVE